MNQCCCNISVELPYNDYFEYFGPDFKLHISPSNMANQNTTDYLEKIKYESGTLCFALFWHLYLTHISTAAIISYRVWYRFVKFVILVLSKCNTLCF